MIRRFSSNSFTGILRSEVAVGTERLRSMFSTILRAGPRSGVASTSVAGAGTGAAAGAGAGAGAGAEAAFGCGAGAAFAPLPSPMSSVKYDRQESSTKSGLLRKRSSSPSTYVALAPNSSAITWDKSALFNFPTSVSQDYHLSHRFSCGGVHSEFKFRVQPLGCVFHVPAPDASTSKLKLE